MHKKSNENGKKWIYSLVLVGKNKVSINLREIARQDLKIYSKRNEAMKHKDRACAS
jgi:hypothetical protein